MDIQTLQAVIDKLSERVDYCDKMIEWCRQENEDDRLECWIHSKLMAKESLLAVECMLNKEYMFREQTARATA